MVSELERSMGHSRDVTERNVTEQERTDHRDVDPEGEWCYDRNPFRPKGGPGEAPRPGRGPDRGGLGGEGALEGIRGPAQRLSRQGSRIEPLGAHAGGGAPQRGSTQSQRRESGTGSARVSPEVQWSVERPNPREGWRSTWWRHVAEDRASALPLHWRRPVATLDIPVGCR